MKQINKISSSAHEELSKLLPWFVNKTLQGAELKALEDHLCECLICKVELIQQQKLARAVIAEGSLDSAQQASFSRLKKRLQTSPQLERQNLSQQVLPVKQETLASVIVRPFSKARYEDWMNVAIARPVLAMAAVILLSVLMQRYVDSEFKQSNDFRTLSNAQQDNLIENEIRTVFAEGVDQEQKNKILERIHGQFISDIPTAQGVYTIRLRRDITSEHLLDVVESLRKDQKVIFAEPAYALLSSMHEQR